jgi:chemotaxis protein histidine kinase CheA
MLQERFVMGLERRLSQLNAALTTLGAGDAAQIPSTADEMMRGFHSLAGIGGTYGFPHITEIARRGEIVCAPLKTAVTDRDLITLVETLSSLTAAALWAKNVVYSRNPLSAMPAMKHAAQMNS